MKVRSYLLIICLVLCIWGCDELPLDPVQVVSLESIGAPTVTVPPNEVFEIAMGPGREDRIRAWRGVYFTEGADETFKQNLERKFPGVPIEELEESDLLTLQKAFYTKYIDADGIAIVSHEEVEDLLVIKAREAILTITSKHPELRNRLRMEQGFYMILVKNFITGWDVPEVVNLWFSSGCDVSHNLNAPGINGYCRARLKGRNYRSDRLWIFVHELAHVLDVEIERLQPGFLEKVEVAFEAANRLHGAYWEYFAEGLATWFFDIGDDFTTQQYKSYEEFAEKDPLLYELLSEWFPKVSLNYCEENLPFYESCF